MKIVITWFDHLVSCHLSSTDESDNEKTKKQRTNETPFTMSRMGGQNINIYMTFQLILAHLMRITSAKFSTETQVQLGYLS